MIVKIIFFAGAREAVGRREILLEVGSEETAGGLLAKVTDQFPSLHRLSASFRLAVNHEYVEGTYRLADGDEVAMIPPVSGGLDRFDVTESPLSLDALSRSVAQESSGAIASFLGIVRKQSRGREVLHLDYEAYREMAIAKMREIGQEIRSRWPVDEIAIVHRVGRLTIGEASIAICISAPHRREALAACTYAIERVKATVPIWKKEVWSDGSEWVGSVAEEEAERRSGATGGPPR
jgi:MoaE-MoaD fusion protein